MSISVPASSLRRLDVFALTLKDGSKVVSSVLHAKVLRDTVKISFRRGGRTGSAYLRVNQEVQVLAVTH